MPTLMLIVQLVLPGIADRDIASELALEAREPAVSEVQPEVAGTLRYRGIEAMFAKFQREHTA